MQLPTIPLPPPVSPSVLEWAGRYAQCALRPMAVRANGKTPLAHGWQSATLDDTRTLVAANPGANLGIAVPAGFVVLDVDVKGSADGRATLAAFELEHEPLPPTLRAATPSGGMHLWFRVPAGVDVPNAVGFAHGLDTRAGGKGYVLAAPSVIDGRPYRWENWGAEIAPLPDWLQRAIVAGRAAPTKPGAVGEPLRIPAGMRNSSLFERACVMQRAGFSNQAIHRAIADLNAEACEPPVPDDEVLTLIASAAKYEREATPWEVFGNAPPLPPGAVAERPASAEWALVSLEATHEFEPLPHLVDRWIPQDEVTLLAGHGGGGKSYVALSLAVHVALGRPFGPLATRQANVLFYSAEDGARVLQSRLARICRHSNIAAGELRGRLTLLDASDIDPSLFKKEALPALHRLRVLVAEHRAELVIIDNASDAFDGDEIKRAEVRGFIRSLRAHLARPGRAVLLLAHINKVNAGAPRAAGAEDYSGSTAWHNSVRSRLSLRTDGTADSFTIEHAKANHGPKADPVQMQWRDGVPIVSNSVPLDGVARAEQREQQRLSVVEIIRTIEGRGGRVPTARTGPGSTFKTLSADASFPSEVDSKTLIQFLDLMQDQGLIHRRVVRTEGYKNVEVFSCSPAP
jgi:hypothetical protein